MMPRCREITGWVVCLIRWLFFLVLAQGVWVLCLAYSTWCCGIGLDELISVSGFKQAFSNKLLVVMRCLSLYEATIYAAPNCWHFLVSRKLWTQCHFYISEKSQYPALVLAVVKCFYGNQSTPSQVWRDEIWWLLCSAHSPRKSSYIHTCCC